MIIKGASRSGPKQLATHLTRTDTNERVEVLELQSPAGNLREAFRDWQTLSEGTRGRLGLYHANIDPAEGYAMTAAQWARAADVLEEELGLTRQPRAVVMHEKHGRQHVHVVWSRTDIDTMTLRADSHNYQAHERASQRLEIEFGHEIVPGKHAKRDRERQPELPQSEVNHAEWQQAERSGLDPRARKAQIRQLWEASDTAPAFAAALEDAGYLLARGDRRDFIIVDRQGEAYSLGRDAGVRAAELRDFMAGIDRAALPSQADAIQQQKNALEAPAEAKAPEPGIDASAALLRAAIEARHAEALDALEKKQGDAVGELQAKQQAEADRAIGELARLQARAALDARAPAPDLWQKIKEAVVPSLRDERLEAEGRRAAALELAHRDEMKSMIDAAEARQRGELSALIDSQAIELSALLQRQAEDLARRAAEADRAATIAEEYERRRQETLARESEGPERDGRAR